MDLKNSGITVEEIYRNPPVAVLYEHAGRYEKDARILENGALASYSGTKTGRSPTQLATEPHWLPGCQNQQKRGQQNNLRRMWSFKTFF
jgi:hypothetical protein